jgi:hypothetical protein
MPAIASVDEGTVARLANRTSCCDERRAIGTNAVSEKNRDGETVAVSVIIILSLPWPCWSATHSLHPFRAIVRPADAETSGSGV